MHDLSAVLDLFAAAETAPDRVAFRRAAVDVLARLLPCDRVVWGELDGRHTAGHPPVGHHHLPAADPDRPLGVEHVLCVALPAPGANAVGIAFHRARPDFDDDDIALLRRAWPALAALVRDSAVFAPCGGLTGRETEVLRRVARGASNGEVGLALRISRRTVEKHLEHVYRKLGVAGRYEAIASSRSSSTRP